MNQDKPSTSTGQAEIARHYDSGYEADRLRWGPGRIELERSRELIRRFVPLPPATVLDIGGGTGVYACWLARLGYEVHLIDVVERHVVMARKASEAQPNATIASAMVGDARSLCWKDQAVDGVLLFGPMYHLTEKNDRLSALREVYQVLKKDGVLLAAGISRFASTLDGLRSGYLADPIFAAIVERDLKDGQHRNPTGRPEYFMDTFFHHPDELKTEVSSAGFRDAEVFGVEGPGWLLRDFDEWWDDEPRRVRLLQIAHIATSRELEEISLF